eukprot:5945907-Alexandrium_andersonii.AAC.1
MSFHLMSTAMLVLGMPYFQHFGSRTGRPSLRDLASWGRWAVNRGSWTVSCELGGRQPKGPASRSAVGACRPAARMRS